LSFVKLTEERILLKSPLDEISESDIIDFIAENSIEGISSQNEACHLIIGLDCQLSHGVVIK
jgi:hypothetical protein